MELFKTVLPMAAVIIGLSACGNVENPMLIFGQQQTVGISIGASPTNQSGEMTLGYKDQNIAIVPVSVKQNSGDSDPVRSKLGPGFEDALSVLGQFEVGVDGSKSQVSLGKFFATGSAATKLAEGFQDRLAGQGGQKLDPGSKAQEISAPSN